MNRKFHPIASRLCTWAVVSKSKIQEMPWDFIVNRNFSECIVQIGNTQQLFFFFSDENVVLFLNFTIDFLFCTVLANEFLLSWRKSLLLVKGDGIGTLLCQCTVLYFQLSEEDSRTSNM